MATVIPTAAVKSAQQGNYVFVVKPDNTAEQRPVQLARAWQDLTVIQSGVSPGEQVIVEGQLRVRPGTKVRLVQPGQQSQRRPEQAQSGSPVPQ